ncbi:hypothetical protein [Enhygromyxa salina]|nr:hypothetical protein [Enhygromyxa salina]
MSPTGIVALVALLLAPEVQTPTRTSPLGLTWQAPHSCPQRAEIDARVHELLPSLGEIVGVDTPADVQVSGRVDLQDSERWVVSLRFESARGVDERTFSGPDCQALGDAAALVIALGVDPVGVSTQLAQRQQVEPKPEPEPEPEPEPIPKSDPNPDPRQDPRRALSDQTEGSSATDEHPPNIRVGIAPLGGGGYGPLQLGQGALGIELSGFGPWWRVALRGRWLTPRTHTLASGSQARFDGFSIAARGCAVPWAGRVEFPICAGVEAGALRGRGTGTTLAPRDAGLPWAALLVGPGLRWVVHEHVALGLDLELLAPLTRGGFTIGTTVAQEFAPVGVQGFAGVEFRLP